MARRSSQTIRGDAHPSLARLVGGKTYLTVFLRETSSSAGRFLGAALGHAGSFALVTNLSDPMVLQFRIGEARTIA